MATVVPIDQLRVLPMDVLADVALGKLRRLLRQRRDRAREMNPKALRMVDRCIVASIEDAMDAGAYVRARAVVRGYSDLGSGWGMR